MKKTIYLIVLVITLFLVQGCAEFLDSKPSLDLVVPSSLDDYQGLLDAEQRGMNFFPLIGFVSADDHVFGGPLMERQMNSVNAYYLWENNPYMPDEGDANWSFPYQKVFYSNVALDGLLNYKSTSLAEEERKAELIASAKFFRAMGHFEVLMHFAEPFDPSRNDQLGVPIRLSSDLNIKTGRSTMKEGFDQIVQDLKGGIDFLPAKSSPLTRPSKWASHALLSRVFLAMHNYEKAYEHSKSALAIGSGLLDYKSLNSSLPFSFPVFHDEVIFYQRQLNTTYTTNVDTYVNPDILETYDSTDMRLVYFFRPVANSEKVNFRGNYTGDFYHFGGLATDEVYLNLAEAAARIGKENEAIEALNHLLENRMETGFSRIEDLQGLDLMKRVLLERRKELLFRGITWLDLKRHNLYPELARTLERKFNDGDRKLPPRDLRYALLIPPMEINLNPMVQNPR